MTNKSKTPTIDSARLEALFASIGEGIIATDGEGKITRINQAALKLLRMHKENVLHKQFLSVIIARHDNGDAIDQFDRPIMHAYLTGNTINARTLYQCGDDELLPVHVTVSPIIYKNRPIGSIQVFRDLTEEIEADKLKSDFISIASHQLRTPLSAINMYTRMLRDGLAGPVSSEQLPYIDTVLTSVERMNVLIDTLLNITRIEAGGIHIKIQPIYLVKLTREIVTEFVPAAKAKSITLNTDLPHQMKPVETDSLLIREVCVNLLSNAIKYTPPGGTVNFELTETEKTVQWKVSDTGYGIPLNEQKRIFLKFFRAANITRKDVSGTGLGLYLIKNIAEALGGELRFESVEDQGSTFYFIIPKHK